jgi:hypothetical protein
VAIVWVAKLNARIKAKVADEQIRIRGIDIESRGLT